MTAVPIELPDEPGWSAVSVGGIHVLVRAGGALVERVRAAADGGDLDEVLDVLSAEGVRATPDFVAVLEGSPLRVVSRGSAYAVGSGPEGATELRASGRGPWVDQDADPDVTALVLHTGAPRPPTATAPPQGASEMVVPAPPAVPAPAAPEATTPPAAEPPSGGGAGWKLPSVFGRTRDSASAPEPPSTSEPEAPSKLARPDVPPADDLAEVEDLPSYDHLFGATQHDRPSYIEKHDTQGINEPPIGHAPIESAGGFDPRDALDQVEQQDQPTHPDHTLAPPRDTARPGALPGRSVSSTPAGQPSPPAHPAPSAPPPPPRGGLIDSVPWRSGGSNVPAPDPAPRPATPVPPSSPKQAADSPVPPATPQAAPAAAPHSSVPGAVPLPPAPTPRGSTPATPPAPTRDVSWVDPQFGTIRQIHAFASLPREDSLQDFVHVTGSAGGAGLDADVALVEQVIASTRISR